MLCVDVACFFGFFHGRDGCFEVVRCVYAVGGRDGPTGINGKTLTRLTETQR